MEIIIYDDYFKRETIVYAKRDLNGREEIIGYDSVNGCLEITTIDFMSPIIGNKEVKPLLKFPMGLKSELLGALTIELSKQNIKTENENTLEGKLIAQEKHLEDMRDITKHVLKMNK